MTCRERTSIKELKSFNSPLKPKRNFHCDFPMDKGVTYTCTNGNKWLKYCFNVYDYENNQKTYNDLVEVSNNAEIVDSNEKQIDANPQSIGSI